MKSLPASVGTTSRLLAPFFHACLVLVMAPDGPVCAAPSAWSLEEAPNADGPGRMIAVSNNGLPVARLVFGDGQVKPFLHLFGAKGELLTNPGLDAQGRSTGQFPHHRGLFIGWKIESDLGNWDLWHMQRGATIRLAALERKETTPLGAHLLTRNEWHAGTGVAPANSLLLTEWRDIRLSQPVEGRTQIDIEIRLQPARDLRLAGDLQHSGVHFRAANEVAGRARETSYLHEPEDQTKGPDLKWCRLLFPIGERWYAAMAMNAPDNPVEELSTRNYGRFGYFFRRDLKRGETLPLRYRFLIQAAEPPDASPGPSLERQSRDRREAQARHEEFLASLRP